MNQFLPRPLKKVIYFFFRQLGYGIVKLPENKDVIPKTHLNEFCENSKSKTSSLAKEKNEAFRPFFINMHHIGGRGGDFPISFPVNDKFLSDLETYIYEADTDCVEHMSKGRYVDHVIPAAVAGADGEGSFNINTILAQVHSSR